MGFNKKWVIYIGSSLLLFFITFMSFQEHFVIFGDSIQQMKAGRSFPIPEWGTYIPARIIGDFFAFLLFNLFFILFAPLLGLGHIADAYSAFNAILYSLIFISLSLASFQYSKLFIDLNAKFFFIYSLVFYVLYISKTGQPNLTRIMAYDVPIVMGLWFIYPFLAYVTLKKDSLKHLGETGSIVFIAILGYFVSFSATNVEIFVVLMLVFCSTFLFFENVFSQPGPKASLLLSSFLARPKWFLFGVIYTPVMTGIAIVFDMNGGRYIREQNNQWGAVSNEGMSIVKSISKLNLWYDSPLNYFLVTAFALLIVRILINLIKKQNNYAAKLKAVAIISLTLVFYFIFLRLLTEFGSRNYFVHKGFSAFFHFFIGLMAITSLFFFNKYRSPSVILSLCIVIISFHSLKQIITPPTTTNAKVSFSESKNVFNSMYMSYCFGADRVPVLIRKPVYPFVPIPEKHATNWFGQSYSKVFSQSVINDDSVRYLPSYYTVNDVNELHLELIRLRETGGNRCLNISDSPYYIQLKEQN